MSNSDAVGRVSPEDGQGPGAAGLLREPRAVKAEDEWQVHPRRHPKRKLAICVGYIGTQFHGLQMGQDMQLPTVEAELEKALHGAECIADPNLGDLERLGWSRMSRTDKGVHALRNVVSAKLMVDRSMIDAETNRVDGLRDALNERLPSSIRVWGVSALTKGFQAQEACSWREYEYLMPMDMLTAGATSGAEASSHGGGDASLQRLNELLAVFLGTHSFHNFTKARAVLPQELRRALMQQLREKEAQPGGGGAAAPLSSSTLNIVGGGGKGGGGDLQDAQREAMMARPEALRTIVRADATRIEVSSKEFLRIRIVGMSFLLHQIRLMVGGAVAVARGDLPHWVLHAALHAPWRVSLPMAPADGLILKSAGFGGTYRTKNVFVDATVLAEEQAAEPRLGQEDNAVLVSDDMSNACHHWLCSELYPHVSRAWDEGDSIAGFVKMCQRERIPPEDESTLRETWEEFWTAAESRRQEKAQRELSRRHSFYEKAKADPGILSSKSRGLLPQGMVTDLSIRLGIPPLGRLCKKIQVQLAQDIVDGTMPPDASTTDLVDRAREKFQL